MIYVFLCRTKNKIHFDYNFSKLKLTKERYIIKLINIMFYGDLEMNHTRLGFLFSVGFILLLSGCQGSESSLTALPYEGEVKINGKPISGAMVVFHSKNTGDQIVSPSGTTDGAGKFRLTSNKEFDGAPAGDYAVTITWFKPVTTGDKVREGDGIVRNFLPAYLANPQTSGLVASVQKDLSQTKSFDLRFQR